MSLLALQQYWWMIISLLASFLVFLMFVQGGQTMIYTLGKTELERKIIVNALGRKWEFTFTTLVTFGGAFFASFPLFYSTSFGGAYWVWIVILFAFVIQAVAYEFRSKPNNFLGQRTFDLFLLINGAVGTILIGVAVSTFFTGSEFSVNLLNITNISNPVISRWEGPAYGLEAVLNWRNVDLGLAIFFLARVLGILYILNSTNQEAITSRSYKLLWINGALFVVLFVVWVITLFLSNGFAVDPKNQTIFIESHKYWHNLIEMPIVAILFVLGVILVLFGIIRPLTSFHQCRTKGIWFAGIGTILTVFSLFLLAGFNNTSFYPSTYNLQSSLTIMNSSSSRYTLTVMSYVSLIVPFVIAYIIYAWWALNRKPITEEEMEEGGEHTY